MQDMQTPGKNTLHRGAQFPSPWELSNSSEDSIAPDSTVPSCRALGIGHHVMLKLFVASVGIPQNNQSIRLLAQKAENEFGAV